jgi:hypothetical protein
VAALTSLCERGGQLWSVLVEVVVNGSGFELRDLVCKFVEFEGV